MGAQEDSSVWYEKDVKSINADAQNLLERYSGLKPEEVLPHVLSLVCRLFIPISPQKPNLSTSATRPSRSSLTRVSDRCGF